MPVFLPCIQDAKVLGAISELESEDDQISAESAFVVLSYFMERLSAEQLQRIAEAETVQIPTLNLEWSDGTVSQQFSKLWKAVWENLQPQSSISLAQRLKKEAENILNRHDPRLERVRLGRSLIDQGWKLSLAEETEGFVLSPDQKHFLIYGKNQDTRGIYRLGESQFVWEFPFDYRIWKGPLNSQFSKDGRFLAQLTGSSVMDGRFLRVWDLSSKKLKRGWRLQNISDQHGIFFYQQPDQLKLVIGSGVIELNIETGDFTDWNFKNSSYSMQNSVSAPSTERVFYRGSGPYRSRGYSSTLYMAKIDEKEVVQLAVLFDPLIKMTLSVDERSLIVLTDKALFFFDSATGEFLEERKLEEFNVIRNDPSGQMSPDGRYIVGKIDMATFAIYDTIEDRINEFGMTDQIGKITFSPDSRLMALSIFQDKARKFGTTELWSLTEKRRIGDLAIPAGARHYQFLNEAGMFLVLDGNARIHLLDLHKYVEQLNLDRGVSP
jgi:hypothetical protein